MNRSEDVAAEPFRPSKKLSGDITIYMVEPSPYSAGNSYNIDDCKAKFETEVGRLYELKDLQLWISQSHLSSR